jgi:hypothetical protein
MKATLITIVFTTAKMAKSYNPFFNEWHCIGFKYQFTEEENRLVKIGELPLTIQKVKNSYKTVDNIGQICEHQDKLFWSFSKDKKERPYSIPFYDKCLEKNWFEIEKNVSLVDSIKTLLYTYPSNTEEFQLIEYPERKTYSVHMKKGTTYAPKQIKMVDHYHMFYYPSFLWSKVTFRQNNEYNHLMVSVNLLPITENRTRWFVTMSHDYKKDVKGLIMLNLVGNKIILDNWKREPTHLTGHEPAWLYNYKYPTMSDVNDLFLYHQKLF